MAAIKKIGDRLLIRLDKGDEIIESLVKICEDNDIKSASLTGIGAAESVKVGVMDLKTGIYVSRQFTGDPVEIASLTGNITMKDDKPFPHIHIVIGDEDYKAFAGHLLEANISVTCEIVLEIIDGEITRSLDEETKANTWDL